MKNIFKIAAIAVVAMSLAIACKSNKSEEPIEDTMPVEEMVMDTIDSVDMVAEEVIPEEPVKTAVKKTVKKAENTINNDVVAPTATDRSTKTGEKKTREIKETKAENTAAPTTLPTNNGKIRN